MATSDYTLMQTYGEWIEKLLDPKLRAYDLRDLAREAISILGIEYDIPAPDFTIDVIKNIENKYDVDSNVLASSRTLIKKILENNSNNIRKINRIISARLSEDKSAPQELIEHRKKLVKEKEQIVDTTDILIIPFEQVQCILRHIISSNRPWNHTNQKEYEMVINSLSCSYGWISDILRIKDGKIYKLRSLHLRDEYNKNIPWNIFIAHIFFNFLFLGGQDYFGFCGYCDKFFLIQRKGRKKYCSDTCRALASRARSAK